MWKARDHRLNRVVALKFLRAGDHKSAVDLTREARAASALNHPNIVTILEIGESDNGAYIAMEFVEGETLRVRMERSKLPFEAILEIVSQMARGLAAAHQCGIVHRDVKPDNVMLRIDGYVKLVDFGLAKMLPWSDGITIPGTSNEESESGQIVGTFSYMSPEQARGQRITPASDVFSFGIILYELLTGEHPFRVDNPMDTLTRIIGAEPVSTRIRCPELPQHIQDILDRCLKKEHTQRFDSAIDLEGQLRQANMVSTIAPPRRRTPIVAAILLIFVLALTLVIWRTWSVPIARSMSIRSIAVMNFRNPDDDPAMAFLAQGLAEDLGGALTKAGFLVTPRSRILNWTGPDDAKSVGTGLQVDAVLEGSITVSDTDLRIHVELVDSKTGFQIWSGSSTTNRMSMLSADAVAANEIAAALGRSVRTGR